MKKKLKVEKERQVHTYAHLWHTSEFFLERGIDKEEDSFHQFMASLVFTAFSFEAFLNHIGKKLFKSWDGLEKLSPKDKLNGVAEFLKVPIDYGERPWQIMKTLFGFRNSIGHGKSVTVKESELLDIDANFDKKFHALALTDWEKYCT